MWTNKYIGIPYLENGRDSAGADCWGLVRHIYKEELDIDLPSFYTDYKVSDTDRISELMSQYKEGWEQLSLPEEKCVVLFRIMGKVSHIGVMINEHQFIHNRRNQNTSIDSIENIRWKNRVVGFFKYSEVSAEKFKELPIALKSTELVVEVEEGFTVGNAFDSIYQMEEIPEELKSRILVYVDGIIVSYSEDKDTVLKTGQKIEYRLVPNDQGTLRSILTIAVVIIATQVVGPWAGQYFGTTVTTAAGTSVVANGTAAMLASMGTMAVGMALVNAIAPIRLNEPNQPQSDSSTPQLLLSGARNDARQYESIPVVLGTYRYVPPVAATNFLSVEADISYLRMLLCWGADTLVVDDTTLRVGATAFNDFLNKSTGTPPKTDVITLDSNNTTSPALELYGQNVFQKVPNLNITYTTGTETDAIYNTIPSNVTSISVSTHFPQGLRGIYKTGDSAGKAFPVSYNFIVKVRKLDPNTLLPVDPTTTSDPNSAGWIYPGVGFQTQKVNLAATSARSSAIASFDPDSALYNYTWSYVPGYTTNIIYMNSNGVLCVISGTTTTAPANSTGIAGGTATYPSSSVNYQYAPAVPTVPAGGKALHSIVTYYSDTKAGSFSIYSSTDLRTANGFTGATNGNITSTDVTIFPPKVTINSGGLTTPVTSFSYGQSGQNYYLRKDACTDTITFVLDQANPCPYDIYIRRTTDDELDFSDRYEYKSAVLYLITGYNAKLPAVVPPKGVPLTVSGLKIQATDQLNGSIDGISALVKSTCIDYDIGTSSWTTVKQPTNNPAALFRYVLQHPTNIQAISDANIASKVDLQALADWYVFCDTNKLTYNSVVVQRRSLLEVMRDICAAGRASPLLVNNKWSVVIDRLRTTVVQHFTPHNSWGFEANRLLTNVPHALRVNVVSAERNYDSRELTVYSYATKVISVTTANGSSTATMSDTTVLYPINTEYNTQYATAGATVAFKPITVVGGAAIPIGTTIASIVNGTQIILTAPATSTGTSNVTFNVPYYLETATLFETISLPGVTSEVQAIKLAKFHLAQAILRPETYSLNVDMEHLVCNRGDLVRVTHDVPMWGVGTGRIKNFISTTSLELSESIYLAAGTTYTIRLRTSTGASVVRNILTVGTTDYYTNITLTAPITSTEGAANTLYMIGTLNTESSEMLITSIEPASNLTAKLTFVDYAPTLYTSFDSLNSLSSFNTNITSTTAFFNKYISSIPTIVSTSIRSDESVMTISGNSYVYNISIPYTNPADIERTVTDVEYRMCLTNDTSLSWRHQGFVKLGSGNVVLSDVIENENYTIQLRYVSGTGFVGPWSNEATHTIVGKATPPVTVSGFSAILSGSAVKLSWTKNTEIDIIGYEIRTANSGWGTTTGVLFKGDATTCTDVAPTFGTIVTWYIKAIDAAGNYSTLAASTTFAITRPNDVTGIGYSFSSNTTGQATVLIKWTAPTTTATSLPINKYLISFSRPSMAAFTVEVGSGSNSILLNADWAGTATFSITSIDNINTSSLGTSAPIVKVAPGVPTAAATPVAVTGSSALLSWVAPAVTSLPIAGYQLSTNNANPTITPYIFKGNASVYTIGSVTSGVNNWYLWSYDTAGKYSDTPLLISRNFGGAAAPTITTKIFLSNTAIFKWTAPTSDFTVDGYQVSLTAAGMTTKTAYLYTTEWEVPVDWIDTTATLSVTAKDIAGISGAAATTTLIMTLPQAPTVPTFAIKGAGITIGWTASVKGSLPIAGYQLSSSSTAPKTTAYIYKGNSSTVDIPTVSSTNNWYLFAYDTMDNYSAPLLVNKSFSGPGVPVFTGIPGTNPKFTLNTAYFKWLPPATSDFAIAYYNLTLTATGMSTQTAKINTTEWEIPVGWSSTTATLTIVPVDVAGLSYTGGANTLTLAKALPTTPSMPVLTEVGTDLDIDWADNTQNISTQLGISSYEIRSSAGNMIWRGTASKAQISMINKLPAYTSNWNRSGTTITITKNLHGYQTGHLVHIATTSDALAIPIGVYSIIVTDANTYTVVGLNGGALSGTVSVGYAYTLYAIDYNNEYSAARTFTYTPLLPTDILSNTFTYDFGNSLTDASLSLNWVGVSPLFGLSYYELTYDSVVIKLSATSYDIFPLPNSWIGNKTFTVKVVDMIGNKSTGTSIVINKQKPSIIPSYSAQVIDNNVMLYWSLPTRTSLPVANVRIKKGLEWNGASTINIGDKNGTFTTIFEQEGGKYTYWMASVDTDKQESDPISFPVTVAQPPDFKFNGTQTSAFTGGPLNTASTFDKAATMLVNTNTYTDTGTVNIWKSGRASLGLAPGNKYYWEITILKSTGVTPNIMLGIGSSLAAITNYVGADANGLGYYGNSGSRYTGGVATAFGAAYTTGDVIGFALDNVNNTLSIYKNNVLQGTAISVTASTMWYPMVSLYAGTVDSVSVNYGAKLFTYPVPDGYNGTSRSLFTGTSIVMPVDNSVNYATHFTSIRVLTMAPSAGGTGYAIGDTFRLNSGTVKDTDNYAIGAVTAVTSGVVTAVTIRQGGAYTVTPTATAGATTTLTGTGTGLTINVTTGGNWASPSAQVAAGFNIYIQPTLATGYYEEVFDFGTPLASSQITLTYSGTTVDGTPTIVSTMSTSLTNAPASYSNPYSSNTMLATNFRYVKVRISASQNDVGKGLYSLNYLNLRLDSKIIKWSGTTDCATTIAGSPNNADGTLANFGKEFVDIASVSITPTGTTPSIPVYDLKDVVLNGTYSVVANVCTVTTTVPHGFSGNALGQQVRLSFSSGSATNGIYTITGVSGGTLGVAGSYNASTVFTVAMTTGNTSGNVSAYSQGMRIYLFDQTGARTAGTVSWSITGN